MKKKIKIQENENNYLQKVCFEYDSVVKLIRYLIRQNRPIEEIEKYIYEAIEKFFIMELAKEEVLYKYVSNCTEYIIDFEEQAVFAKI